MTPQEAIKRIKDHNEVHSRKEQNFAVHITEALYMACEALEKQIPQKPYEETIANEEGYMTKKRSFFYCCPNCFYHLNENQKYCDDCGQALDWSDAE